MFGKTKSATDVAKTTIEIKSVLGTVLFTHEAENNTLTRTLESAVLRGAVLEGAYLEGADLKGAVLEGAYLKGAYLRGADLRGAVLKGADLRGADLECADLRGADLRGAKNIPRSFVNMCSRDMLFIFHHTQRELPELRQALVDGRIDGTCYTGECCCLIGTLAKADGGIENVCNNLIPFYEKGLHNPAEQWFFQIRVGDTPINSEFAKHAVELIDRVLGTQKKRKTVSKNLKVARRKK